MVLEDACFHAQQAVEKSVKAVLTAWAIHFPKTHNLFALFDLLPSGIPLPPDEEETARLTEYAAAARYPGSEEPVTGDEYREALRLAQGVVE